MKTNLELIKEIIEYNQKEKCGLTVYSKIKMLTGTVKRVIADEAVSLDSQQSHLAIIRLDKIEAMSVN